MGKSARQSQADRMYAIHLNGDSGIYNNNPTNNRLAMMERMYMRVLTELAANRFKWEGLPDEIDHRFLELNLFYRALTVFFKDTDRIETGSDGNDQRIPGTNKFMAMRGTGAGGVNYYDNPVQFTVDGPTFISRTLTSDECVPIWANYLRVPDLDIVMIYAHKLAQVDTTVEINAASARRNKIMTYGENQRLSMAQIQRQLDDGEPLIQLDAPLGEQLQAIDLGIPPNVHSEMHILRTRLWSECMTLLGIDNANQDKKERLVSSEVDANDDQISSTRNVALNARRIAAKQINKMFGLSVTVDYAGDLDDADSDESAIEDEPDPALQSLVSRGTGAE